MIRFWRRDNVDLKPWSSADARVGGYTPRMLGMEERKLLFHLARDVLQGNGSVADLGAFCGASAVTIANGLDENPNCCGTHIHSYDLFIADDYIVSFAREWMNTELSLGESFEKIYRKATKEHSDRIVVHAGDLNNERWSGGPIEMLFVDAGKTKQLAGHIAKEFYPAMTPGESVLVHQDFYHPSTYWLIVAMDVLADHFSILEERMDWSTAYRLESSIPQSLLDRIAVYDFSFEEEKDALRRSLERLGEKAWPIRMAECALIAATPGQEQGALPVFSQEQRADAIFPGNAAYLRDYCGVNL